MKETKVPVPYIISSDGFLMPLNAFIEKYCDQYSFAAMPTSIEPTETWDTCYIKDFIEGKSEKVTIQECFEVVKSKYRYYMDFSDPRHYTFFSLWTVGTYFYRMFETYPYVFINATKRSGKTKLLTLTSMMAFNGKAVIAPSSASIFRMVKEKLCTLCIDEIEKISKTELSDIRSILLSGYKKGMKVTRTEEEKIGGRKVRFIKEYDVYSPKMMANIMGIENTLQDRCITVILLRTTDKNIGSRNVSGVRSDEEWKEVRNKLYLNMMLNWKKVKECYDMLKSGLVLVGNSELAEKFSKLNNRILELWQPIFAIAMSVSNGVFEEMLSLAVEMNESVEEEDIAENVDVSVLMAIIPIVTETGWYFFSELANQIRNYEDLEWVKSRNLSNILSRLGLRKSVKKVSGRKKVFIRVEDVKKVAKKFGIDYDEIARSEYSEPARATDKFHSVLSEMARKYPDGFEKAELEKKLMESGIPNYKVDELIQKALAEGIIYEPREGVLKRTGGVLGEYV